MFDIHCPVCGDLIKKTNYKKSIGKMQKSKKILHNEWINMHVKKT